MSRGLIFSDTDDPPSPADRSRFVLPRHALNSPTEWRELSCIDRTSKLPLTRPHKQSESHRLLCRQGQEILMDDSSNHLT